MWEIHQRRLVNGRTPRVLEGECGDNCVDDAVEIVIIPVTAHPRGVGRFAECNGRERGERHRHEQRADATGEEHESMIAPLVGAVKNRVWLPECLGVSRGAAFTIVFRPRSPGFEGKRSSLPSAHRDSIAML
jgi:hypothetical protein